MALIIKSLGVDTPNYDELSDDEDDFVKDPAQYRDQLPQPYRYIDELLGLFLDDVWDEITRRDDVRVAEKSKKKPPKYECSVQLEELTNAKALTASEDGRYLFAAYPGGLALMDPSKRKLLNALDDDRLDLTSLKCVIIGMDAYMLVGVDEIGLCKTFGCTSEKIFPMKIFSEENMADSKLHTVKCDVSLHGDYIGVVMENPSSDETILEVFSLPRDTWCKEIEAIKSKLQEPDIPSTSELDAESKPPNDEQGDQATADDEHQLSGRKSTESKVKAGKRSGSRTRKSRKNSSQSLENKQQRKHPSRPGTRSGSDSKRSSSKSSGTLSKTGKRTRRRKTGSRKGANAFKFTPATLVMKHRPSEKLRANAGASPSAAMKDVADPKSILGSGQGHLLSRTLMEIRQESFNALHKDKFVYRKQKKEDCELNHRECNFHFFTPGLAIPFGIEQPGSLKKPNYIGIWWSGSNQFIFYCLTKPVKPKKGASEGTDAAHKWKAAAMRLNDALAKKSEFDLKPETIWPQAGIITSSATSPDSSLIAIGLENGIVTIWDKLLGCVRKTVTLSQFAITKLAFMDPCICPQANNIQQAYPTTTSCYVLARTADSCLQLVNCGQLDYAAPIRVADKATDDDNAVMAVFVFPERCPEIVLRVNKNGTMYLIDVITTDVLCEIALPPTHEMTTPWDPKLSIAAYGQMLYVKGTMKSNGDEEDQVKESLFVFQLRSFPTLDNYWIRNRSKVDFTPSSLMDVRIGALLSHRVKSSGARQQRLQQRWPLMKQELTRISQVKSH